MDPHLLILTHNEEAFWMSIMASTLWCSLKNAEISELQ